MRFWFIQMLNGSLSGGSATSFDRVLNLLRETIPAQADHVAQRLGDFQYCHQLLRAELEMRKGSLLSLNRDEAENARFQWDIHNAGMQLIRT